MRRVLVTGSREWPAWWVVEMALTDQLLALDVDEGMTVVHGVAAGADAAAARWVSAFSAESNLHIQAEEHPALWDVYGRRAGILRNQKMVDRGADVCLAFPLPSSRGTLDCMSRAYAAGIPIVVYNTEGSHDPR